MGVEGFKVVLSALDLKVDNVFCRFGTVAGAAGYDEIMQIVFTAVRFWMDMITIGRLRQLLWGQPLSAMEAVAAMKFEGGFQR